MLIGLKLESFKEFSFVSTETNERGTGSSIHYIVLKELPKNSKVTKSPFTTNQQSWMRSRNTHQSLGTYPSHNQKLC